MVGNWLPLFMIFVLPYLVISVMAFAFGFMILRRMDRHHRAEMERLNKRDRDYAAITDVPRPRRKEDRPSYLRPLVWLVGIGATAGTWLWSGLRAHPGVAAATTAAAITAAVLVPMSLPNTQHQAIEPSPTTPPHTTQTHPTPATAPRTPTPATAPKATAVTPLVDQTTNTVAIAPVVARLPASQGSGGSLVPGSPPSHSGGGQTGGGQPPSGGHSSPPPPTTHPRPTRSCTLALPGHLVKAGLHVDHLVNVDIC